MKQEDQPSDFSRREPNHLLRGGMYCLAVVAGVATAGTKVWESFYSKIKHTDLIAPLSKERYDKINAIYAKAKEHGISNADFTAQVSTAEKEYSKQVRTVLKEAIGIESEGFVGMIKGTLQRAKTISPRNQGTIAFAGAITMGTTLGAYFLVNQNVRLKQELRDIHTRIDADQGASR